MATWNIEIVIRTIWNQNFTQLVSTNWLQKTTFTFIFFHQMGKWQQDCTKEMRFLCYENRNFENQYSCMKRVLHVSNKDFLFQSIDLLHDINQLVITQTIYSKISYSICNSYEVILNNSFHVTPFRKRWHHWRRRKFISEKHETFE